MENFYFKYGERVFTVFLILTVIPALYFETESNRPYITTFKYVSVPVLIASFYIYMYKIPNIKKDSGKVKGPLFTALYALMISILSGGLVVGVNGLGPSEEYRLEGYVSELKYLNSKSGPRYMVKIEKKGSTESINFDVSKQEYGMYRVGSFYSRIWRVGMLGFLYK